MRWACGQSGGIGDHPGWWVRQGGRRQRGRRDRLACGGRAGDPAWQVGLMGRAADRPG